MQDDIILFTYSLTTVTPVSRIKVSLKINRSISVSRMGKMTSILSLNLKTQH